MFSKRRRRNRFSNLFGGGLLLASSISLVSIGFSTWSICDRADADINIAADDVIEEQVVSIKTAIYNFSIGPDGLVIDHTISSSGTMTIGFSIDNVKASSYLSSNGGYKATITLLDKTNTTFLTYVGGKPTCSIASSSVSDNSSKNSNSIINSISFPSSSGNETAVRITYTITDKTSDLKSELSSKFYNSLPSLSFSVSLEDVI